MWVRKFRPEDLNKQHQSLTEISLSLSSSSTMPRATTDRFVRAHQPSAKASGSKEKADGSTQTHNPIFNTERFGQHILKNPLVAQG
jgi:hypothetical protein